MHTIFFTINCVEQLTFSKTFVDQLQFEQLKFFCLKVKLLNIHVRQMIFDFRAVDKKVTFGRTVSSKWKIVSSRFFEQTIFEQMIMTRFNANETKSNPLVWTFEWAFVISTFKTISLCFKPTVIFLFWPKKSFLC
jgi:hypothetical protein